MYTKEDDFNHKHTHNAYLLHRMPPFFFAKLMNIQNTTRATYILV